MPPVIDEFVVACRAVAEADAAEPGPVREELATLVKDLVGDPQPLAAQVPRFGELDPSPGGWILGGEHICYQSKSLTVMVLDTLPGVTQPPHDHAMVAIIGVFEGAEEQRFWARTADGLTPAAGRTLEPGDTVVLGDRAVHAISSPKGRPARAVHVYLGDIYAVDRSLFHPETLAEAPYSSQRYDDYCRAATA